MGTTVPGVAACGIGTGGITFGNGPGIVGEGPADGFARRYAMTLFFVPSMAARYVIQRPAVSSVAVAPAPRAQSCGNSANARETTGGGGGLSGTHPGPGNAGRAGGTTEGHGGVAAFACGGPGTGPGIGAGCGTTNGGRGRGFAFAPLKSHQSRRSGKSDAVDMVSPCLAVWRRAVAVVVLRGVQESANHLV